jgi:Protein of unknown function (DUF664)
VPDLKPPRVNAGERETLQALLQYQRDSLVRKITGTDETTARRPAVGSGTTLLWLVKHMARAEIVWVVIRFAGQDVPAPDDAVQAGDTIPGVVSGYRAAWARADSITLRREPGRALPGKVPSTFAGR